MQLRFGCEAFGSQQTLHIFPDQVYFEHITDTYRLVLVKRM